MTAGFKNKLGNINIFRTDKCTLGTNQFALNIPCSLRKNTIINYVKYHMFCCVQTSGKRMNKL